MKKLLLVTVGVAALLVAPVYAQNLLVNPGVDDPPDHETDIATGWTLVEDVNPAGADINTATFASFANHNEGGTRGLWYRPFQGGLDPNFEPFPVDATLYQDVPGMPGEEYTLSAWFRYELNYSGVDPFAPTQTFLAMDFLDAGQVPISSVELDVDTVQQADGVWREFSVMGVAPAGTAFVRARTSMIDGVQEPANPQSAFVDEFTLIPEPASLLLLLAAGLLRRR